MEQTDPFVMLYITWMGITAIVFFYLAATETSCRKWVTIYTWTTCLYQWRRKHVCILQFSHGERHKCGCGETFASKSVLIIDPKERI